MTRLRDDQKIFGLGLSKTATSTLAEALNILGVRTIHYPNDKVTFDELKRGNYRLSILEQYQAVTDTPVAPYFAQLDRAWPGSKFILTVREKASWLRSAELHWQTLKETGPKANDERFQAFADFVSASVYGCIYFNAERFSYAYDTHVRNVEHHFAGRQDDLLVFDICGGKASWEPLCNFLGLPIPENIAFPHAYRSAWKSAERANADLSTIAADDQTIIVVDFDGLRNYLSEFRHVMPFVERGGRYWGLPDDDHDAIRELERQRAGVRAKFLAITTSSLWFFDKFPEFAEYTRTRYPCILSNDGLMVFDLR